MPDAKPMITAADLLAALDKLEALELPSNLELVGVPELNGDTVRIPAMLTIDLSAALQLGDLLAVHTPKGLEAAVLHAIEGVQVDETPEEAAALDAIGEVVSRARKGGPAFLEDRDCTLSSPPTARKCSPACPLNPAPASCEACPLSHEPDVEAP